MLSQQAKQDILAKISAKLGCTIFEDGMSPSTLKAISALATLQKHLYIITTLLRAEESRVERHAVLRLASKVHPDKEIKEQATEISKLQIEVDNKAAELANRILEERKTQQTNAPLPTDNREPIAVVELKCIECGAPLPIPTSRFVKCQYCNTTFSIEEFAPPTQVHDQQYLIHLCKLVYQRLWRIEFDRRLILNRLL